ncbi:MAG: porin family protein [Bacteroidota bacterium]
MKRLSLICLALLLSSSLFAQIEFGGEAGIGFKNFTGQDVGEIAESITEGTLGLQLIVHLPGKWGIQTGLVYDRKGSLTDATVTSTQAQMDYLVIPVSIRYTTGKLIKPFAHAGLYAGYLIDSKNLVTIGGIASTVDNIEFNNRLETGATFGLGLDFPKVLGLRPSVEWRNYLGLSNINNAPLSTARVRTFGTLIMLQMRMSIGG